MSSKHTRKIHSPVHSVQPVAGPTATNPLISFLDKALAWGLGLLCLFISICFYTGTYDTAFVKITLLQTGGIALTAIWFTLLAVQKRFPVNRQNLPWLLPFIVYFAWNFITYLFNPYKIDAFEEMLRYVLYAFISFMVLDRFGKEHTRILVKCIVLAAWISCVYGFVQVLNRWIPGVDIMPWRGFFGTRIFSTHANPNFFADFVVFSSFITWAEYIRTRQKRLLFLLGISLVDLFFSESKGAWLGFAVSAAFGAAVYTNCSARVVKYAKRINLTALSLLLAVLLLVGVYAVKRFQSVSFRAYTWASIVSMVQDSPVVGTGLGSFKTIYPAYRKPQIFYIEKIHNNETQHAENEYLEQWATTGTIGLALFLWLIFFVLYSAWRGLKSRNGALSSQDWLTWGCMSAFFGICVHNFFDVSMRFVSTGLFFYVFAALTVRQQIPPDTPQDKSLDKPAPAVLLWMVRLLLCGAVAWLGYCLISGYAETANSVGANGIGGACVKAAGWLSVCGLTALGAWAYLRAASLSRWIRVPVILICSIWPLQFVYGFFLSDHYYGIAAEFSRRNLIDGALDYYQKAIEKNPFAVPYHQYRAYVLRTNMQLQRSYSPVKGDAKPKPGQQPLNDYDRILNELTWVEKQAPNNALIHQAFGEFYYTSAVLLTNMAQQAPFDYQRQEYEKQAVENMEMAKKKFQHSLLIDPVNEATYVYLTSIALMERNPAQAQYWIDRYRKGPENVTEKEFLKIHQQSIPLTKMEQQLHGAPYYYHPEK